MTKRAEVEFEYLVEHAGPDRRQGNGHAYADIATRRNPVTPASRTGGPATPGGPPAQEPRLHPNACYVIASARQSALKFLDLSIEIADLVAAFRRLKKLGWLNGGIDPDTARPIYTPAEQAIVIAEVDDRRGAAQWTQAQDDTITAEAAEILRGQDAYPTTPRSSRPEDASRQ